MQVSDELRAAMGVFNALRLAALVWCATAVLWWLL